MKQREVFDFVYGWTKSDTQTMIVGSIAQTKLIHLFMSGDTGVGKSFLCNDLSGIF